jgi:uncharacterized protein YbjT (DUF2867 family)
MPGDNTILVLGATGQQGGAVANELLNHGYKVRALTRKPQGDAAQTLAKRGAAVVAGDLNDASSVEQAMRGVWGVFSVQNTWEAGVEREEEQGKRVAHLVKKLGVQHLVYSSVGSANRKTGIPHFDNKWRVEEEIRSLGLPSFTIVRPVFFMDNFVSPWFKPGIEQGKLLIGIKPDTVLQMIAVEDIGKYGRWAFTHHASLNRKAIDVAGDAKTMPEVARIISSVTAVPVEYVHVPIEEVRKFNEDFAIMLEWFDRVGYNADIKGRATEAGIKPTTLAEWAAKANWS